MNLEGYYIGRELSRTAHSTLFEARADGEEWGPLHYILKMYSEDSPSSDAQKEMIISQLLENHSDYSVSIPILRRFQVEGRNCLLMQQKKSGKFLKEIYEEQSKHDLKEILETAERILSSLEILHGFMYEGEKDRILHLDLHPGNIFIENYHPGMKGTVKFIDFSNAVEEHMAEREEVVDLFPSGYSPFSAPELVENETEKLCEGTDLYSVASIMFWMMTGRVYREETALLSEIDAYGDKENHPSIIRSAIARFFQCGFEYNTLYRFKSASEMRKAVIKLRELTEAADKSEYTHALQLTYNMAISTQEAIRVPMRYNAIPYTKAIGELENNLRVYQIDTFRRKYEFDYYWEIAKKQDDIDRALLQRLIRCGITVCNYSQDVAMSDILRQKYEEYKDDIPVMEYLNLSTKLAEQDIDKCRYHKAYDRDMKSLECMKMIKETYKSCANVCEIKGIKAIEYKDLARTYSATGRCVSFMANECTTEEMRRSRQNEALQYFRLALNEFGDDLINRQISLYHLMHLLIDMRSKSMFEKCVPEYFGTDSVIEWLQEKYEDNSIDLFKMHLCLRSLYYLYPEMKGESLSRAVSSLLEKLVYSKCGFPVELVYKYIGLLLHRNYQIVTDSVRKAFQSALNSFGISTLKRDEPLTISEIMAYQIWSIYNEIDGRQDENDGARNYLLHRCHTNGWNELYKKLQIGVPMTELLGYEYS